MQSKQDLIPVHRLDEMIDQGFHIERVASAEMAEDAIALGLHRDDHYIIVFVERGSSEGVIDFEPFSIREDMIVCVLPGQVHSFHYVDREARGWFVALDPGLIPETLRGVLEDPLLSKKPLFVGRAGMSELIACLELADKLQQRTDSVYNRQAIYMMLASLTAMITGLYAGRQEVAVKTVSRAQSITRDFRKMLAADYKKLKSPGEYAAAMHLSLSYFNEAVKEATGFNVGYWIQKEILLEAKRLLYYGKCSVKEIAHELGYEDHTYFSRMFKKAVGKTPGAFRGQYHR